VQQNASWRLDARMAIEPREEHGQGNKLRELVDDRVNAAKISQTDMSRRRTIGLFRSGSSVLSLLRWRLTVRRSKLLLLLLLLLGWRSGPLLFERHITGAGIRARHAI
jgi:hypothetical protein